MKLFISALAAAASISFADASRNAIDCDGGARISETLCGTDGIRCIVAVDKGNKKRCFCSDNDDGGEFVVPDLLDTDVKICGACDFYKGEVEEALQDFCNFNSVLTKGDCDWCLDGGGCSIDGSTQDCTLCTKENNCENEEGCYWDSEDRECKVGP